MWSVVFSFLCRIRIARVHLVLHRIELGMEHRGSSGVNRMQALVGDQAVLDNYMDVFV